MATGGTFVASGIVTLTSDFGLQDPFVGVMKGQILARFAGASIVDLSHEVVAHWPVEAGFWLARSYRYFPAGTVHVAVVDPGVGGPRGIAIVEGDGHLFLAPDNGLLGSVVDALAAPVLRRLSDRFMASLGVTRPSATFHGRDIFAPVAAEVAAGRVGPDEIGERVPELVPGWLEAPTESRGQITGAVVTIDHFGNLITNIDGALVHALARAQIKVAGVEIPLRRTYSDVRPGDYLALINSFGVLEIARAEQSAAEGLGLARGAPVVVSHK
jgi:hypothetical protein